MSSHGNRPLAGLLLAGLFPVLALATPPDKSGVKPSAISLPSGAGSIEGLGESFEPQLNTGSSSYGIAIALPPGRAGLAPKLRLAYNSSLGNSFVGLGWSLELPSIKRQTDKGFPSYSSADVFLFGGEELVPLSNPEHDWRCENESDFKRFRQIDTDDDYWPDGWEVTERNGTRNIYGQHRGSANRWSVVTNNLPNLPVFDTTFCWALDTTIDLHGNRIEYEYLPPDGDAASAGVLYPSRIRYSLLSGNYHEVRFRYEDRPDAFDDCRPTFPVRIGKRLAGIEVYSFYEGSYHLVRTYDLEYDYRAEDGITMPSGAVDLGVSTLKRFVQHDRSGTPNNYLPPLLFEYSPMLLGLAAVKSVYPLPVVELGTDDGSVQIADVDGDGLPDLFQSTTFDQRFCLNRGELGTGNAKQLTFSDLIIKSSAPALQLNIPDSTLTDWNNDGLVDYVQLAADTLGGKRITIYPNASRLEQNEASPPGFGDTPTVRFDAPAGISFTDPAVRQMDVNFDKTSDFIKLEPGFFCQFTYYYTDMAGAWHALGPVFGPPDMPGALSFELNGAQNPAVHLADMNGDRLQDLVYLEKSSGGVGATLTVHYWPYRGLAEWGEERTMELSLGDSFQVDAIDPRDVLVQDLTGDGLADIVIMRSGGGATSELELRVNVAGRWWAAPFVKSNLPRYQPHDPYNATIFRQADLNGNGSSDLIWRNRDVGDDTLKWLDLLPNGKPNLLVRIDNSLGKRTEITYGSSTEDMIRAREAGYPWQTKCPFPNQVVRRIRTTGGLDLDGVADAAGQTTDQYVAEFLYRDAYYDASEREFRGFAFAERIDYGDDFLLDTNLVTMSRAPGWEASKTPTGQVSGPTLVTRFRYLTGAPDGVDNDEYPINWSGPMLADDVTPKGGREEEILKGRQVWLEKVDPWVLHDPAQPADFDRGAWLVLNSANAVERNRLTPDDFVYTRIRQDWAVRRLYRPNDSSLAPSGRFAEASPAIMVRDGQGGSGRSVSFAFVSAVTNEVIEANGLLHTALAYPQRNPVTTAQTSDNDDYGNPTAASNYGVVSDPTLDDERFSTTEYALGGEALTRWIIGLPARVRVTDENGVFVSETRNYYDGGAYQGLALGLVGARALLHRTEQLVTGEAALPALASQSDRPGDPRLPAGTSIQTARHGYDSYGNATSMLDPLGAPGNLAAGHGRQIDYDATFKTYPVQETIFLGAGQSTLVMSASYDYGLGTVTSSTDFNGNLTSYEYDSFARLVAIVKPGDSSALPTAGFSYLPADPNRFRIYAYDRAGNLTIQSSGSRRTSNRVVSRLREVAGQAGTFTSVSYTDGLARKLADVKEGDASSQWIVSSAQSYNRRLAAQSQWLPYDLVSGTDDSAPPQFGELWPNSRPPGTDLQGRAIVKSDKKYDPLGREIMALNPPERTADIGNEAARSHTATQILPLEKRLFDENDTQVAGPNADTPMVQFTDGLERLIAVQEVVRLNDDGTAANTPVAWITRYQYDLNDNLVHIRDSQNNEKWFRYDGLKRKLFMNDPDRGVMTYTYDEASNLRESVDAKGQHIAYAYDGVNRLLTEKYVGGLPLPPWRSSRSNEALTNSVVYHYDQPDLNLPQGDGTLATAANTKGMLSWVEDLSGEEHTSYDARGRVAWVVKRLPDPQFFSQSLLTSATTLVSYRTAFDYDSLDRVTALTYPDNDQLGYRYTPRNLLHQIVGGVPGSLTPAGLILTNLTYRPSDQLSQIDYGNGVRTTYEYDPRLRLNSLLTVGRPSSGARTELINFTYDFDGVSNIKAINDNRPTSAVPATDPRRNSQVFAYDDLYRITQARYNPLSGGTNTGQVNYRYDRIGNMLAQTSDIVQDEKGLPVANLGDMDSGGPSGRANRIGRQAADPPGPHALTEIRGQRSEVRIYPYDANGNMTQIDGLTNTWDFKDRLVQVEDTNMAAAYTYDYTDRRVLKRVWQKNSLSALGGEGRGEVAPSTVLYPDKYFEVREHDAPTKYVWNGNTRVARVTGSLSPNQRVQRLRVWPGWNFCSLAVSSPSPLWGEGRAEVLSAAFRWNSISQGWETVAPNDTVPAGTVLWLRASTNATLAITGTYSEPTNKVVFAGGNLLAGAGLEVWNLPSAISNLQSASLWSFDGVSQCWDASLPTPLPTPNSPLSTSLAPGDARMVRAIAPSRLEIPDAALRVRYYHQDHLGSSSVITDAAGQLVEEMANYAFGYPRQAFQPCGIQESYKFTQKEEDSETDLDYFESRYYSPITAIFMSCDTLASAIPNEWLTEPQRFSSYSYSMNRCLTFTDPSGRSASDAVLNSTSDATLTSVIPAASFQGSSSSTHSSIPSLNDSRTSESTLTASDRYGLSSKTVCADLTLAGKAQFGWWSGFKTLSTSQTFLELEGSGTVTVCSDLSVSLNDWRGKSTLGPSFQLSVGSWKAAANAGVWGALGSEGADYGFTWGLKYGQGNLSMSAVYSDSQNNGGDWGAKGCLSSPNIRLPIAPQVGMEAEISGGICIKRIYTK